MKEYDFDVYGSVKVSLQKQDKQPVIVAEFTTKGYMSSETDVGMTLKVAKSLRTKLDDLIKKAEKIAIDHPELPLK
jgi:hypothetical protein